MPDRLDSPEADPEAIGDHCYLNRKDAQNWTRADRPFWGGPKWISADKKVVCKPVSLPEKHIDALAELIAGLAEQSG